jgi:REP element-mobilizing transposase RayT
MDHRRRSIRLPSYDYRSYGAYFVTICAYRRDNLFGEIRNGVMGMNWVGDIVVQEWQRTADIRPNVQIDEFVVMPNHFHGILWIVAKPDSVGATRASPLF